MSRNLATIFGMGMMTLAALASSTVAQDAEPVSVVVNTQNDVAQPDASGKADVQSHRATELHNAVARPAIPEGYTLLEGDIVVPAEVASDPLRMAAAPNLWPNGVVPYVFDAGVSADNRTRMLAAMAEWEAVADVDFRARTNQADYVFIKNDDGNWSSVGRVGGRQEIGMYNWNYRFIMAHELAHCLGVWHEQSRPDRDNYIEIVSSNIQPASLHNFNIHSNARMIGPYNFDSIMHYGGCAFTRCSDCSTSCLTIRAKAPYADQQSRIGQRDRLSTGDINGMRALYGAPPAPPAADLVLDEITLPSTFDVAESFTARVKISNRGTAAAGAFDVNIWVDGVPVRCDNGPFQTVSGLAAGQSTTLTFANLSYATVGSKTFSAYVDSCEVVTEPNDNNNKKSIPVTVVDYPTLTAPTMVSATAGERSVTFNWTAVAGATGYKVFYDEDANAPFEPAVAAAEGGSGLDVQNVTSFRLTRLKADQTIFVAVRAYHDHAESPYSNTMSAMPFTLVPVAPSLVSATGGERIVTIKWNSVSGAIGYRVYYDEDSANPPYTPSKLATEGATVDAGNVTQIRLTGLPAGHSIRVAVTAYNAQGESDFSNELGARTNAAVTPPPTPAPTARPDPDSTDSGYTVTVSTTGTNVTGTLAGQGACGVMPLSNLMCLMVGMVGAAHQLRRSNGRRTRKTA